MQVWDLLGNRSDGSVGAANTYSHDTAACGPKTRHQGPFDTLVQWQNWRRRAAMTVAWFDQSVGAHPTGALFTLLTTITRKVAQGRSIVALPQGTTSSVRNVFHQYAFEGEPQLAALRAHSDQMGETIQLRTDSKRRSIFCWLNLSVRKKPMFLFVGLENFLRSARLGSSPIRWPSVICENRAKTKKLVFVSGVDVADYYQRHYSKQPENWFYWAGYLLRLSSCLQTEARSGSHGTEQRGVSFPARKWLTVAAFFLGLHTPPGPNRCGTIKPRFASSMDCAIPIC